MGTEEALSESDRATRDSMSPTLPESQNAADSDTENYSSLTVAQRTLKQIELAEERLATLAGRASMVATRSLEQIELAEERLAALADRALRFASRLLDQIESTEQHFSDLNQRLSEDTREAANAARVTINSLISDLTELSQTTAESIMYATMATKETGRDATRATEASSEAIRQSAICLEDAARSLVGLTESFSKAASHSISIADAGERRIGELIDQSRTHLEQLERRLATIAATMEPETNVDTTTMADSSAPALPETDPATVLSCALSDLQTGKMLFNPPETMKLGCAERIEARLTKDPATELREALRGRGVPEIDKIEIGTFMTVTLTGESFEITCLSNEHQLVRESGYSEWAWGVTPLTAGRHSLHLHVSVRFKLPECEEIYDHPVMDRDLIVTVNYPYLVKRFTTNNWRWIATAVLLPLLGWIARGLLQTPAAN